MSSAKAEAKSEKSEFTTSDINDLHLIKCPSVVEGGVSAALDMNIKTWLISQSRIHVLDFKETRDFKSNAIRPFVTYAQTLKSNHKFLFAMNVPADVLDLFKQNGLSKVFPVVASTEEARTRAQAKAKSTVDVEFINPFIDGVIKVLSTQAQIQVTAGKAILRKPEEKIPMDIAGELTLKSSDFNGSFSLFFKTDMFLKVYEGLTGEKCTAITAEMEDAAAEILNMVFGHAKSILNDQKGFAFEKALPRVLAGEKLRPKQHNNYSSIVIPFNGPAGVFHIEILVDRG